MLLFRAFFRCWKPFLKYWEPILKEKHFPASGKTIFADFLVRKSSFSISRNASFRAVETDFLVSTNHILYIFFQRLLPEIAFFLFSGNFVLNESFVPARIFLSNGDCYLKVFLLTGTVTAMSGNQFLKAELILVGKN